MSETFRIEPLSDEHDRTGFVSGSAALDRYFQAQASQDVRRRIATCFVAVSYDSEQIAWYYTLSATSIAWDVLSPQIIKKLPRYPVVPAALLGRLAVARTQQGLGLGGVLLADALKRSARAEMGGRDGCGCRDRSGSALLRAPWIYPSARRKSARVPPDGCSTSASCFALSIPPSQLPIGLHDHVWTEAARPGIVNRPLIEMFSGQDFSTPLRTGRRREFQKLLNPVDLKSSP